MSKWNLNRGLDMETMSRLFFVAWAAALLVSCATLTGIAFVVYKLMLHFGVL